MPSTTTKIVIGLAALAGAAEAFTTPVGGLSLRTNAARSPLISRRSTGVTMCADRTAEIKEVMKELTEFRGRIVDDATELAKKVKAKPRDLRKTLESHQDILKIDQAMEQLEAELEALGATEKA